MLKRRKRAHKVERKARLTEEEELRQYVLNQREERWINREWKEIEKKEREQWEKSQRYHFD